MLAKRSHALVFLSSLATAALVASVSASGCQSDPAGSGGGSSGDPGSGGSGNTGNTSGDPGSGATGGTASSANANGGSGATGSGGAPACDAPAKTIEEITTKAVGPDVEVTLKGVVAMSHKFLVFKSNSTGSCLWGLFVSSPGLAETKENSGILVISYGDEAVTGDAGTFCPKLGEEPTGGNIPDDVRPGDVLDIVGKTDYFKPSTCGQNPGESSVDQFQLASNSKSCGITKTGTAAVPTPHLLTGDDVAALASPTDTAFHDKWGGVKVRIENVTPIPWDANCPDMGTPPCLVNQYGEMQLEEGNLLVQSNTYYRGYMKDANKCHASPIFDPGLASFASIEGFSRQDYCTWTLEPHDKCADTSPASTDCGAETVCPFTIQ